MIYRSSWLDLFAFVLAVVVLLGVVALVAYSMLG